MANLLEQGLDKILFGWVDAISGDSKKGYYSPSRKSGGSGGYNPYRRSPKRYTGAKLGGNSKKKKTREEIEKELKLYRKKVALEQSKEYTKYYNPERYKF